MRRISASWFEVLSDGIVGVFGAAIRLTVGVAVPVTVTLMAVVALRLPEVPLIVTVAVPFAVALAVTVSTLDEVADFGLNEAVTPFGRPFAVSATLPVNPLTGVMVTVLVPVSPCFTFTVVGEADSANFLVVPESTVRLIVVVLISLPEVPVIVMVAGPVVAVELAAKVKVLMEIVGFVPNVALTPLGKPKALSTTLPEKPPEKVTVIVLAPLAPCLMVSLFGFAVSPKEGPCCPTRALIRLAPFGLPQPVTKS